MKWKNIWGVDGWSSHSYTMFDGVDYKGKEGIQILGEKRRKRSLRDSSIM